MKILFLPNHHLPSSSPARIINSVFMKALAKVKKNRNICCVHGSHKNSSAAFITAYNRFSCHNT